MPATIANMMQKLANQDLLNRFFDDLEVTAIDKGKITECFPSLVADWELQGKTLSVPWDWVMILELMLVAFLSPTAILKPIETISIYAVVWCFLLHPGATGSSNVIRLYQDIFDIIELKLNRDREGRAATWSTYNRDVAAAKNPFLGLVSRTMGSGSLEGEGKKAKEPQNFGSACAFMPEAKKWISWCTAESSTNSSIVLELFERAKWHRVTVHDDRSFTIMFPHFVVSGALHIPDVAPIYMGDDPVGLKGRLWFYYSRPSFKRAADISAACQILNADGKMETRLADKFFTVAKVHTPYIAGEANFYEFKGYLFRKYTLNAQAQTLFETKFDYHVEEQENFHLKNQEKAKFHGKAKTRNLRWALLFHIIQQARAGVSAENWGTQLNASSLVAANILGDFIDNLMQSLENFFVALNNTPTPQSSAATGSQHPPLGGRAPTKRETTRQMLQLSLDVFLSMPNDKLHSLYILAKLILVHATGWTVLNELLKKDDIKQYFHALPSPITDTLLHFLNCLCLLYKRFSAWSHQAVHTKLLLLLYKRFSAWSHQAVQTKLLLRHTELHQI